MLSSGITFVDYKFITTRQHTNHSKITLSRKMREITILYCVAFRVNKGLYSVSRILCITLFMAFTSLCWAEVSLNAPVASGFVVTS